MPASTVITLACGHGPSIDIDGQAIPTSATGTLGNLINLQPMAFQACLAPSPLMAAGRHVMTFPAGSALRMTVLLGSTPSAAASAHAGDDRRFRAR